MWEKFFEFVFFCDWRVTSATDVSDQGGYSCVQNISVTLCEENIMFWEVSGIGTEVIGLLWNLPFLEYFTGLLFLGLFLSFIVPSWSLLFSVSCYLSLVSVSCF